MIFEECFITNDTRKANMLTEIQLFAQRFQVWRVGTVPANNERDIGKSVENFLKRTQKQIDSGSGYETSNGQDNTATCGNVVANAEQLFFRRTERDKPLRVRPAGDKLHLADLAWGE